MSRFQFKTSNGIYPVNVNIDAPSHPASSPVSTNATNTTKNPLPHSISDNANKTTIVFLNALGVPLKKYSKLINGLTQRGFTVVSADYPCCGENTPHLKRGIDYGYDALVHDFIDNLVQIAYDEAPDNRVVLAGHSLGGHLGTLYSALYDLPMIGIATGSIHYKCWQGSGRFNIFRAVIAVQTLIKVYGYLPGHLIGFGGREAKTMMHNWCQIAITGKFDFITAPLNTGKGRGLFINITGDNYAPLTATQKLAKLCKHAKTIVIKLDDDVKGNPHGVWIKNPEPVIESICEHLDYLLSYSSLIQ